MNNQGKLFKSSAASAPALLVLSMVIFFAGANARGAAGTAVMVAFILTLAGSAFGTGLALASYREDGRRPGSTPLIYAVIAVPVSLVLFFLFIPTSITLLPILGMLGFSTAVLGLVIGLVKKLSAKPA